MRISLLAASAVLLLGGITNAQERGGFDPAQIIDRIFESDANKDGKISKDEANERILPMFELGDTDKDGMLSKEEVTAAMAGRMRGRGRGGEGRGRAGAENRGGLGGPGGGMRAGGMLRMMALMPVIKALDKDGNNELSKEEIENAVAALKTLDKDNDGKISTEEMSPDMSQFGGRGGRGAGRGGPGGDSNRPRRPPMDDDGDK